MVNVSLFKEFSKQSPKGVLVIYAQLLYKVFKASWVLVIVFIQQFSKLPNIAITWIYIGGLGILLFFLIRAYLIYKNFLFKIEDSHFILKEGILKKKNTSISFDRIQNINFKQNIIQQLINVYEVSIETAGSKSTEIAIKALSFEKAQALKVSLSVVKKVNEDEERLYTPKPLLKIGFLELLKVSLTENHLQNLLIFVALLIGLLQQLKDVISGFGKGELLDDYVDIKSTDFFNSLLVIVFLIIVLLLIGIISSFVRVVLFHFNLSLFIKDKTFEISQGLLTKKSIVLSKEKIQNITISTNPVKRKLGISFVTFKQAISGKVKKQQNKLIRIIGCRTNQLLIIKNLLYGEYSIENETEFLPNKYYLIRMYFRNCIGLLLLNSIIFFLINEPLYYWINTLLIPLLILLVQMKYKKAFYKFNNDILLVGKGRIETHNTYLPMFKVQNIKMKQTLFQQKRNVVDLILQTASGKIKIPCIEKERAIKLYNYILFKVESNNHSWM